MKNWLVLAFLALSVWMLGGCETVKGVGRDITKAGEAIEDATR